MGSMRGKPWDGVASLSAARAGCQPRPGQPHGCRTLCPWRTAAPAPPPLPKDPAMTFRLPAALLTLILLAGCATPSQRPAPTSTAPTPLPAQVGAAAHPSGPRADDNLNAVAWTQTAIEHDLIYLQTYRDAESRLLAALHAPDWDALSKEDRVVSSHGLKPAVILDIDETVLDNSPYQARAIRRGGEFNEAEWQAWCREEAARAMPGAVEFTRFAASHGIAVIYVSNRAK